LLLVLVKTTVDLQLLQTSCVLIQLAMNRSRRVSVVSTLMAVLLTYRFQFSKDSSCFSKFLVTGHLLHFNKGLQFCFMEDLT